MRTLCFLSSFLLLLATYPASSARSMYEEKFVGWMGEVYHPNQGGDVKKVPNHGRAGEPVQRDDSNSWIRQLSWKPRAYLFKNFISHEEADYLVKLAVPQMMRSTVENPENNTGIVSDYRSSYGMFIRRNFNDVLKSIQGRVANWTHLPEQNQEDMQILRYSNGQQYRPHLDILDADEDGGPRIATVLIYLTDIYEGGETAFVADSEWADENMSKEFDSWSECAKGHVAVKPRKGDALLFFSVTPDGEEDPASEHAGCPVPGDAVKWSATVWIRASPFRLNDFNDVAASMKPQDPGDCEDLEGYTEDCIDFATMGYCEKNYTLMVGGPEGLGVCRKSCSGCTVCAPDDRNCYLDNRRRANFLFFEELWPENGVRMPYANITLLSQGHKPAKN